MLKPEDIDHLATLARITLSEAEKLEFPKQFEAILDYVGEVSTVVTLEDATERVGSLRNVMREDSEAYPGGEFTKAILQNAPRKEDNYIKVQQIF